MQFSLDLFSIQWLIEFNDINLLETRTEQSVVIFFKYLFSPLYCLFMFTDHGVE